MVFYFARKEIKHDGQITRGIGKGVRRGHRLIARGAAVESVAPKVRGMSERAERGYHHRQGRFQSLDKKGR